MNILAAGNENDSTNENEKGILLDDGAYCVPLSLVADPDASNSGANLVTDWYRTALLEVENGQYNITFRIGSVKGTAKADESTRFKVLKEEYNVHDISSTSNYNLGNIDSGIYENSDLLARGCYLRNK